MTKRERTDEISGIELRLSALEQQLSTARNEERKLIQKRNRLNDDFNRSRLETLTLREERDRINEKVQTLKILRDEIHSRMRALIEELKKTNDKIIELKKKTPKRKHNDLQQEVEEIEWKIQTTSLDITEEKRLIGDVKQLETQLQAYRKIEKQQRKANELRSSLSALRVRADDFHKELNVTSKISQEIHAKMITKTAESKKIKEEADSLHLAHLQTKERVSPIAKEYRQLSEQRMRLLEELKAKNESEKKGKQKELKERLVSEARNKLQQGKQLSWDEFQLLNEENHEKQN